MKHKFIIMLGEKVKFLSDYNWAMIWPKVSLVLFFLIFLFIVYMAVTYKKKDVEKWESMPLDLDDETSIDNNHLN